jgi:holo-[acyl-carrier protein] synthase
VRVAVGVDIVEVSRVVKLLTDHPAAEAEIFTADELRYCSGKRNRHAHLAARFAAKEAVLKALGTGLGPGMRWVDVEVRSDALGRPRVVLHGKVAAQVDALGGTAEISLSHTGAHAIAHASLVIPIPTTHKPPEELACAST